MRNLIRSLAPIIALLTASQAVAQNFPLTMPPNTFYGRASIGAGPGSALPFQTLLNSVFSANPNTIFAGPSSGGAAGNATFRAIVGADLPAINLAASGAGGVTGQLPIANNCPGASGASSSTFLRGDCTWGTPNSTILTSNNTYTGNQYFGSGSPWVDVKSGANACPAAVGNGTNDDASAVQCQATFMNVAFGGGLVFMPPGNYHFGAQVTIPPGVWLIGTGISSTFISVTADVNPLTFGIVASSGNCPSGNHNGGLEKIMVTGYNNAAAATSAVSIGNNCNVTFRDFKFLFGANGLNNTGADGHFENGFVWGYTGALLSSGANWYKRMKFDQPSVTGATYAYKQIAPISGLTTAENHFEQSDFSGTYTDSILIVDGSGSNAVTTFVGCVTSAPIVITQGKATMFSSHEFGSTTITGASGFLNIVGSYAFSATTATGAGSRSCAGNANITC